MPEPRPRPIRLRALRGCAGFRLERFSSSLIGSYFSSIGHEVANLAQHALQLRRVLVLGAAADLAEAERAQRAEVAIGLTDPAADLRDLERAHSRRLLGRRIGLAAALGGRGCRRLPRLASASRRLARHRQDLGDRLAAQRSDVLGPHEAAGGR